MQVLHKQALETWGNVAGLTRQFKQWQLFSQVSLVNHVVTIAHIEISNKYFNMRMYEFIIA